MPAMLEPALTEPLVARPRSEIPWDAVGEGWVVFTFGTPKEFADDPGFSSTFTYGLYLMTRPLDFGDYARKRVASPWNPMVLSG